MSDLNFDRIWAVQVKGLETPPDSDANIGFDYLGPEYPTTHLHDVMFQGLDLKSQHLWRQIRNACARYGVAVSPTDDETYTNALGEAIHQALLKQVRASEQNVGIIQLADTKTVVAGTEYNMAVSPAQLKTEFERRFKDYTPLASFNSLNASLSVIAKSGQLVDGLGYLGYERLSNIPRWIRETHDDGNFLYIRSADGTQFRLGASYFDMFNANGDTSFRINSKTGDIEAGYIHQSHVYDLGQVARDNNYYSLNNLPSLGDAAHRPTFDTGDVNAIPWDGNSLPTTSVCRALKDFSQSIKDSLKTIATSGNLNDGYGVLDKQHGGRGRGDNSFDGTFFYANGNPGDPSNQGFVIGDNTNNKICGGADNGDDITQSANVNIDTWFGFAIRSSINKYAVSWKHDARTGNTRQIGDFILLNGDRSVRAETGMLSMTAPSSNFKVGWGVFQFYSDKGHIANIDGNGTAWVSGDFSAARGQFNNQLEVRGGGVEIYGATPFIDFHFGGSSDDYTSRLIATAVDRLELSSHFTIRRDLQVDGRINGGGLGSAAYCGFGGDGGAWSVSGNDNECVRSSQFANLRSVYDGKFGELKGGAYKDIYDNGNISRIDDIPWGSALATTGTLRSALGGMLGDVLNVKVKDPESYAGINWGGELVNQSGLMRIKYEIDNYLGSLKGKAPYNTEDAWAFAGDSNELATTKTVAAVRNNLSDRFNALKTASSTRFNDLVGATDYVLTTRQFVDFKDESNTCGGVGSYTAVKANGTGGGENHLKTGARAGWVISDLSRYANWDRANYGNLSGTWIIMAVFSDVGQANWDRDILLCKRLR